MSRGYKKIPGIFEGVVEHWGDRGFGWIVVKGFPHEQRVFVHINAVQPRQELEIGMKVRFKIIIDKGGLAASRVSIIRKQAA